MCMINTLKNRPMRIFRWLYRLLILVVIVVITYSIHINFWIFKEKQLTHSFEQKAETSEDNSTQEQPTLESPLIHVTSIPEINWNKNTKPLLPWYFKNGHIYPDRARVDNETGIRISKIWPEEQIYGDRVEEQLMFVPPNYQYENAPMKTILIYDFKKWWIDTGQSEFLSNDCPVDRCLITHKKHNIRYVDAVIFRENVDLLNNERPKNQVWIFYFLQSPYYWSPSEYTNMVWTATYQHNSDIVIPYGRWAYYDNLSVTRYEQPKRNYAQNKTKFVAMVASDCQTDNGRLLYAKELRKYVPVDIYGECGDYEATRSEDFFKMLGRNYKFYLAFENKNCIDYITEKFFVDGLQFGMLPIVMGGRPEDYKRIAPKNSYLHVDEFESPRRLALHLLRLHNNDDLYNEYFRWKGTGEFIDTKFFCRLCAMLHDDRPPAKPVNWKFNDWWLSQNACDNSMKWRPPSSQTPATEEKLVN